jgi:hypothetical protein
MQDKEIWLPIPMAEVAGLYTISSHGRVKTLPKQRHIPYGGFYLSKERLLSQTKTYNGYYIVTLSNKPFNKSIYVHILVATLFIPNPHGYKIVNHKDYDKTNNHHSNLEWCTRSYNTQHSLNFRRQQHKKAS